MVANDCDDSNTSLAYLKKIVDDFVREREWEKFHAPKNISMALAIEAAELMEHFQWIGSEESRQLNDAAKSEVAEELADVICYSLAMANQLGLDLTTTVINKMSKNCQKYPAEEFRGRYRKS
jgi:NTP pyrophosphatase (non-canonical NTP hydrolase)